MTALKGVSESIGTLRVVTDVIDVETDERWQFVDLTDLAIRCLRDSGVREGLLSVQTRHTTTAVIVNENEPLLLADMRSVLERLVPKTRTYLHNDLGLRGAVPPEETPNGDAHCKAMLLGASESLAVRGGKLQLGCWQRIFLVELDGSRRRSVLLTILGLAADEADPGLRC
jgi:secondary thiamine-phosphate synthase enzyme